MNAYTQQKLPFRHVTDLEIEGHSFQQIQGCSSHLRHVAAADSAGESTHHHVSIAYSLHLQQQCGKSLQIGHPELSFLVQGKKTKLVTVADTCLVCFFFLELATRCE